MPRLPVASKTKIATTEVVIIYSSIPRGNGPNARVIRRKADSYMLPRSPQSPTLHIRRVREVTTNDPSPAISGSSSARLAKHYKNIEVSELEVEAFQLGNAPLPPAAERQTSPRSWSPTFPDIQVKSMNIRKAHCFNPSDNYVSRFSQLHDLDMLPALGLAEEDFWCLFSRCGVCLNFMTTRTIPYHVCPGSNAKGKIKIVSTAFFLSLLDVHNIGYEAGVPEDVFEAIFYTCGECGRYMTQRISSHHMEGADWDSDDETPACVYLQKQISDIGIHRVQVVAEGDGVQRSPQGSQE